jgi:hypothetical protein
MPAPLYQNNGQYTLTSTAGTTTLNQAAGAAQPGMFYGGQFNQNGTSFTATYYDIVGTNTNQITATQTASGVGQQILAGPAGLGVRYRGTLVLVTGGTPGLVSSLWD